MLSSNYYSERKKRFLNSERGNEQLTPYVIRYELLSSELKVLHMQRRFCSCFALLVCFCSACPMMSDSTCELSKPLRKRRRLLNHFLLNNENMHADVLSTPEEVLITHIEIPLTYEEEQTTHKEVRIVIEFSHFNHPARPCYVSPMN